MRSFRDFGSFDSRPRRSGVSLVVLVLALFASTLAGPAAAVVVQQAEVVGQNTTAAGLTAAETEIPDWLATLNGFLVTAVGPHHVLAAAHIGGSVGSSVVFAQGPNAGTYSLTVPIADPVADLRLWEIDGTLSSWAPLYDASVSGTEIGKTVTIFGRGAPAGEAIVRPNDFIPSIIELKGWLWGTPLPSPPDWSWGRNVVDNILPGPLLEIAFDRGTEVGAPPALPNECHISNADSSGPWFIDDGLGPALAGVSSAALGPFRETIAGATFNATLLDYGGFFLPGATQAFPDLIGPAADFPSTAAGVRISERLAWLTPLLVVAGPDTDEDGVADAEDSCIDAPNPDQTDTDADGFGNACDCDFNQDLTCNISDFNVFLPDFLNATDGGTGTDMNDDGTVNISDFNLFLQGFLATVPGPSGIVP